MTMLRHIRAENRVASKVINEILREGLTLRGYATKRSIPPLP